MTRSHTQIPASPNPTTERCTVQDGWASNSATQSMLEPSQGSGTDLPFLAGAAALEQQQKTNRAKDLAGQVEAMVLDTTAVLLPGYLGARDSLELDSVAELGGRIVGAVGAVRGGRRALGELLAQIPEQSLVGSDPQTDLDLMAIRQRLPTLDGFIERLEAEALDTLVPHRFGGREVGAAGGELGAGAVPLPALGRELQRTLSMISLVTDLRAAVLVPGALEPARLADLRRLLEPWAARPLDLAFLQAALGPVWTVLDQDSPPADPYGLMSPGRVGFLPAARPSDLMAGATERAETTGWLGDTGRFDIDTVHMLLIGGDKEGALFALRQLYSADRASRPKLLEQMAKRGDLGKLCETLGEDAVRALHDDLPGGYPELKEQLREHFSGWPWADDDEVEADRVGGDVGILSVLLADADKETSGFALDELFDLSREQRTAAVKELHRRGLLDSMLKNLGWAPIRELYYSLSPGASDIKTHLEGYFIGKGKYGPSLDSEWESHESSLYSLIGRIPYAGKALNTGLNFVTFGFHSSYGSARDANTRGETSDAEFARTRNHIAGRTALMAAVSMVTGGGADKFLRGAGTGATVAGIGAGMVGGASGLATSDTYNMLSGEQEGFSSFEDYVKAVALGGVVGGVFGRVTEGLTPKAARHTELPSGAPKQLGAGEPVLESGAPKQLGAGEPALEAPVSGKGAGGRAAPKAPAPETWPAKPGDPAYSRTGPARQSNPTELAEVLAEARRLGATIHDRPGGLGYQPSSEPGVAGELALDPDASWSAIMHEMQHLADDAARGFPGAEKLYQPNVRWELESAAYAKEISMARRRGDQGLIRDLEAERLTEWQKIFKPDLVRKKR